MIENEYRNGESQRSVPVNNSRKRWRLAKRLPPTPLQALRDFYDARTGPTEPFYFYDPYETNPKFSWDRPAWPRPAGTPSGSTSSGAKRLVQAGRTPPSS